jgi:hypothetical protein
VRGLCLAAALAWAGCVGPPLPSDPAALEAELRARAEALRDAFASFQADGSIVIDGPERHKLNWRAEAVRGQWARVALWSSLATDPVVEVRVRAGEGLAVRVSPPGATATLYRAPAHDLSMLAADGPTRAAAEWLAQLARDENVAMPSPSAMQVTDGAVRLELARGPLGSLVTLRRSDGMPVEIEAWVRGDPARTCVLARRRGDRALRVGGTPLSVAGDLETTVVPCCNREALVSIRIAVARLVIGPPDRLSRWSETARPIERIRDDRWLRRTFREADIVREKAARACPGAP